MMEQVGLGGKNDMATSLVDSVRKESYEENDLYIAIRFQIATDDNSRNQYAFGYGAGTSTGGKIVSVSAFAFA